MGKQSKPLVVFDGDGTLWENSSWGFVSYILSDYEKEIWHKKTSEYFKDFISNINKDEKSYIAFHHEMLKMLEGKRVLEKKKFESKIIKNYEKSYRKGAKELIDYLKSENVEMFLVSGGFPEVVEVLGRQLGIKYIANVIEKVKEKYTGKIKVNVTPFNKSRLIKEIMKDGGFKKSIVFFDVNDISIINNSCQDFIKILMYNEDDIDKANQIFKERKTNFLLRDFYQAIVLFKYNLIELA